MLAKNLLRAIIGLDLASTISSPLILTVYQAIYSQPS